MEWLPALQLRMVSEGKVGVKAGRHLESCRQHLEMRKSDDYYPS